MPVVRVCFKQRDCHKVFKKAWKDCLLLISIFYMVFISAGAQSAAVSGLLEVSDSIGGIGAVNINSINAIYSKDGITIWEVTPNANYPHTTGLKFYAKLDDNSDSLSILLSCDEEQASLRGLIPSLYDDDNYALSTTPDEYHYCYEYTKSKTLIYAVLMDTFSDLKAKSVISQAAALANNPSYKCSFTDKVFILGYYFSAAEYDNNWLCFHNWPWGDGNDLCKYNPGFRGCEYSDGWVNVDLSLDAKNTNNYYIYGGVYNDNSEESRISVDNAIWLRQINWGGKNGIKNGKANIPSKITLFGRKTWSVTSAITWMAIDADSVDVTCHMTGAGQTNVDRPEELDVLVPISLTKSPLNWLSEGGIVAINVTKTADPTSGAPGSLVNFTINVTNTGDCDLHQIEVIDTLPEGMIYISAEPSPQTILTWNFDHLVPGEKKQILVRARISDEEVSGTLENNVDVIGLSSIGCIAIDSDTCDYSIVDVPSIHGYVRVQDGENLVNAAGIPVYIWQKDVSKYIWSGITNDNGYYDSGDLSKCPNYLKDNANEFAVEAKWENDNVKICETIYGVIQTEVTIGKRFPILGYTHINREHWNIVFDDDDALRDYHASNNIYNRVLPRALEFVEDSYLKKVEFHIHGLRPSQAFPDGSVLLNENSNIEDIIVHEYGHALHFKNLNHPLDFYLYHKDMCEAWAIFFESFLEANRFSDRLENDFNYCNVPIRENARAEHIMGQVYAGILHDLRDNGENDDDDFDGQYSNGAKRIWDIFMNDEVTNIDILYNNFAQNSAEREALNEIYAKHGLISPAYDGRLELVKAPTVVSDMGKLHYEILVVNEGEDTLNYELQFNIYRPPLFPIYYAAVGQGELDSIPPGQERTFNFYWTPPELPIAYYITQFILVPKGYSNYYNVGGEYVRCAECSSYIDMKESQFIVLDRAFVLSCPADMEILDPDGLKICKGVNEIHNSNYTEIDLSNDGEIIDIIMVPNLKFGYYAIKVIPEPVADPDDTFTLVVYSNSTTLNLAESVKIKDIPDQPYIIEVTENGDIIPLDPPALAIEKTSSPTRGAIATEVNFTINVTNTGGIPLTSIKVVDAIPKGMSFKSSVPPGTAEANNVNWNLGPLAPGSSNTIHLIAQLNGEELGILSNEVNATGIPEVGNTVFANATANVTALEANITVEKTANLSEGAPGARINFTIKVENTGDADFVSVDVEDLLPEGLDYVSDDSGLPYNLIGSRYTWNLEALAAGVSKTFNLTAEINGEEFGDQVNVVNVTGYPEHGDPVQGGDSAVVVARSANISMEMTADPELAALNSMVTFTIRVTNTGEIALDPVVFIDDLPAGMTFVSADPAPNGAGSLRWDDVGPGSLDPGESTIIKLVAMVDGDARAPLVNHASASGCPEYGNNVSCSCSAKVGLPGLSVNKTAEKTGYKRGEEIVYTIEVTNLADVPVYDVVVRDVFSRDVEFVSADPAPDSDGVWRFDVIPPKGSLTITLVVLVPDQEFEFDAATGVSGEGFVNVAGYYSTTLEPYSITNRVSVTSASTTGEFSASETVNVLADPGTELETREHGSGAYESDEMVRVRTENKSISMDKDVAATYAPTTLGLYNNRTVAFASKWTEEARSKNRVTSTSMSESYRYATFIDRESRIFLDENQSVMDVNSDFDGRGHIGLLKMPSGASSPRSTPTFEMRENYVGSFKMLQKVDEYGSSVTSDKAAAGQGLVVVDKRISSSQRTYESGTGTYDSEELIKTSSNYIAKDISLVHGPMSQRLTDDVYINASMKWKEGMYSKVPMTSYIGEEYTGITRLDKETVARGLNEMDTEAGFSGQARFRSILEKSQANREVDFDEQYTGDYSIQRRVLFTGVSKYGKPHLNVTKTLDDVYEEVLPWEYGEPHLEGAVKKRTVAIYTIRIENDGDRALQPVLVKDLFPPGAIFIEPSSVRPDALTETSASWNLTHISVGGVLEIVLKLDVTKYYQSEIVNRVEVCGGYNGEADWVCAANFSAIEKNWFTCCLDEAVSVAKTAEIDPANPRVVRYRIEVSNHDDATRAATVTDHLPAGMDLLETSIPFASYDGDVIVWNILEIDPGETVTIEFSALAPGDGRFTNSVEVDARSVDGAVVQPVYATCVIDVGVVEDECGPIGCGIWQTPNWEFQHAGYDPDTATCEQLTCASCEGTENCLAP